MQLDVRVCVLMDNPTLAERVTRLCAAEGWHVWIRQPEATNALPADTHVLIVEQSAAASAYLKSVDDLVVVVINDLQPAQMHSTSQATLSLAQIETTLIQTITRNLNVHRFQNQFFSEHNAEPITQLPHHSDLLAELEHHRGEAAGFIVLRVDHAEHLYANLDPVSKTDLLGALGLHLHDSLTEQALLGIYDAATFAVRCLNVNVGEVAACAQALIQRTQSPLFFRGGLLHFSLSIGWSFSPKLSNPKELWRSAWQAAEKAQRQGGNQICTANRQESLVDKIPEALNREEFSLALQPQWNIAQQRISGVEALLRWHGMEVGDLAPDQFIPIFERTDQMIRVGDWVLEKACSASTIWLEQLVNPIRLGINISPQQFVHNAINKQVDRLIKEQWLDPTILELEMVHDNLLHVVDQHRAALFQLRDLGVHLAIDNLGRGLVDTKKLLRCPADTLKIDRSLVAALESDVAARALVEQICLLGQRYNLRVVGVGVESEAQRHHLEQLGCTDLQGYLLSEPITLENFPAFLNNQ